MRPSGPIPAEIMLVGEAPGREEELAGVPFIGASGSLLNRLLSAAGIERASCFITNVSNHRPPGNDISEWITDRKTPPSGDWSFIHGRWVHPNIANGLARLRSELEEVRPKIVIALGNTPLWALTGKWGISRWRGSRLSPPDLECNVVPTFHPAACLRQRELSSIAVMDLKRAKAIYEYKQLPRVYEFLIAPTFEQACDYLNDLLNRADDSLEGINLAGDLETRAGHIACFGIASGVANAICIPFLRDGGDTPFYWDEAQEAILVHKIIRLFLHPKITWIGQNYLYDCQYFYRFWNAVPLKVWDTMIGHHAIYAKLRKGLDFLSSMYAQDHIYWKDEAKNWDPAVGERQLWEYNCKDCCITYEIWPQIVAEQAEEGVSEHFYFQQNLFFPVLRIMNRGIRIDVKQREALSKELTKEAVDRQEKLTFIAGHELNPKSPIQLQKFFYNDLRIPGVRHIDTAELTTNSSAMVTISQRVPVLKPLCQLILEARSIGVFLSTFIGAKLDVDGRMRSSFSVAGTINYRFTSSENAFDSGANLQNIPKNTSSRQKFKGENYFVLPNIRKLFIPDEGMTFFDLDLDRADMQCVAAEADDKLLKEILAKGIDIHCFAASEVYNVKGIPFEELIESHPNYPEHRARIGEGNRDKAKNGGHATDYGVGDRKLAVTLGITVAEASRFRSKWFGLFPGIALWHTRVQTQAAQKGYIENPFGARLYTQGDFDLPEALAWGPSSTVSGVINRALIKIDAAEQRGESSIQLLLQVHDSLAGQFLTSRHAEEVESLRRLACVEIPYSSGPLIIPVGIKTSTKSWGDCK